MKDPTNGDKQTIDRDRLLKKRELAERLGVSIRTLDAWQRQKRITHYKIGKACRYSWADVIEKLDSFRVH